jgi:hypothetical protein
LVGNPSNIVISYYKSLYHEICIIINLQSQFYMHQITYRFDKSSKQRLQLLESMTMN